MTDAPDRPALVGPGETTDTRPPDLTIPEVRRRYQVSERTIFRRLAANQIEGAHQIESQWYLPQTSIERQGWKRRGDTTPAAATETESPAAEKIEKILQEQVAYLQSLLDLSQRQLTAGEDLHRQTIERAARAEAELGRADADRDRLTAERTALAEQVARLEATLTRRQRRRLGR